MDVRKVRIASSQFDIPKTIETDAETWGDLKPLLLDEGIRYSDMGANLSPQNHSLDRDDAALPEGDINIFLFPQKVAAGNDEATEVDIHSVVPDEVASFSYNVLRSFASQNNVPLTGNPSKDELVYRIISFNVGVESGDTDTPISETSQQEAIEADNSLMEALKEINEICSGLIIPEKTMSDEDEQLMSEYHRFTGM
jgi:hypothetical protein